MNQNIIELCKKLKALAEQGVGGEAINSAKILEKLLKKHNIQFTDLEKPEKRRCEYDIMLKHQDLFWAIVFNVIEDFDGKYRKYNNSKRKIILELTHTEELLITSMFDHYVRSYDQQLKMFTRAFICKNELFATRTPEYEATLKNAKPLSKQEMLDLILLEAAIRKTPYKSRLANEPLALPKH